jgi:transcriptional regulator with XRE-family HTH domain
MSDIYKRVGESIRDLRIKFKGKGISQEDLAKEMQTTANTISRWETATYKPSVRDLERLALFFKVPITIFFPGAEVAPRINALLSATGDLDEEDFDELTAYAQLRRARSDLRKAKIKRRG